MVRVPAEVRQQFAQATDRDRPTGRRPHPSGQPQRPPLPYRKSDLPAANEPRLAKAPQYGGVNSAEVDTGPLPEAVEITGNIRTGLASCRGYDWPPRTEANRNRSKCGERAMTRRVDPSHSVRGKRRNYRFSWPWAMRPDGACSRVCWQPLVPCHRFLGRPADAAQAGHGLLRGCLPHITAARTSICC